MQTGISSDIHQQIYHRHEHIKCWNSLHYFYWLIVCCAVCLVYLLVSWCKSEGLNPHKQDGLGAKALLLFKSEHIVLESEGILSLISYGEKSQTKGWCKDQLAFGKDGSVFLSQLRRRTVPSFLNRVPFIVSRGARFRTTSNDELLFSTFFQSVRAVNRESRREPSQPTHKAHQCNCTVIYLFIYLLTFLFYNTTKSMPVKASQSKTTWISLFLKAQFFQTRAF